MKNLIYATLEPNRENTDGSALTLFFKEEPSEEEVKEACRGISKDDAPFQTPLGVDPDNPDFYYEVILHPVADEAGLTAIQCHPTC